MSATNEDLEMQKLPNAAPEDASPPPYPALDDPASPSELLLPESTSPEDFTTTKSSALSKEFLAKWLKKLYKICRVLAIIVGVFLGFMLLITLPVIVVKYGYMFFVWWFEKIGISG